MKPTQPTITRDSEGNITKAVVPLHLDPARNAWSNPSFERAFCHFLEKNDKGVMVEAPGGQAKVHESARKAFAEHYGIAESKVTIVFSNLEAKPQSEPIAVKLTNFQPTTAG